MKFVLTGGTGYLGGRLLTTLLALGHDVAAIVQASDDAPLPRSVARIVDPGTSAALADALSEHTPDATLHLAASQLQGDSPEDSDALVEANVAFGSRVLAASRSAGARGLVWASTFSLHVTGTADYQPQSLYAASKQAFSAMTAHYNRSTGLRCTGLELSDTYGPADPRPKLLGLLAAGEPFAATAGEQIVRPLHADDVAAAFVHAAREVLGGRLDRDTYSVAGPEAVSLRDLAARLEQVTGRSVDVRWGERPYRANEIMDPYVGEPLPGWSPRYTLTDGLASVYCPGE